MSLETRVDRLTEKVDDLERDAARLRKRVSVLELYSDTDAWERLELLIAQAIAEEAGMAEARAATAIECTALSRDNDTFRMVFWCDDVTFDLTSVDYRNSTGRTAVLIAVDSSTGEIVASIDLSPTSATGVSVNIPPGRRPNMNRNSLSMNYTSPPPV